jgi:hypothetical protein
MKNKLNEFSSKTVFKVIALAFDEFHKFKVCFHSMISRRIELNLANIELQIEYKRNRIFFRLSEKQNGISLKIR